MGMKGNQNNKFHAEINVTPLVDVMLVLLIIFMISAPLMFSGVALKLPKTKKVSTLKLKSDQTVVSITESGDFYLGKEKYEYSDLLTTVKKNHNLELPVFVRADHSIVYGIVAKTISDLKILGVSNISLVTTIKKKD